MATTKVVVDPITRIEGHLRIEAQAENGRITNAWATSTQFRGIEIIMQGRDPRDAWAFTQRICGVCTVVHAVASLSRRRGRARHHHSAQREPDPEPGPRDAVHPGPRDPLLSPARARLGGRGERAQGRPGRHRGASRGRSRPGPTTPRPTSARCRTGSRSSSGAASSASSPTATGDIRPTSFRPRSTCWRWRTTSRRSTGSATSSGCTRSSAARIRTPTSWWAGWRRAINLDDTATINAERLTDIRDMITRAQQFVEQVYWPDLLAIAGFYKDWAAIGGGVRNYLAVGEFPDGDVRETEQAVLPPRHHPRAGPHQGLALRPEAGQGVHHQLVVRVLQGRRRRPAPLGGRDQAEVHRPADAVEVPPGLAEVHLDEGAALRRQADGGRSARADAGGLRRRATRRSGRW